MTAIKCASQDFCGVRVEDNDKFEHLLIKDDKNV